MSEDPVARESENDPDPLEAAWGKVLEEWQTDEVHRKFVALCQTLDRLDFAGTRYRAIREGDEDRAAVAKKQIDRILSSAMASLELTKTEPSPAPRRRLLGVALVLATGLIGLALWVYLKATSQ